MAVARPRCAARYVRREQRRGNIPQVEGKGESELRRRVRRVCCSARVNDRRRRRDVNGGIRSRRNVAEGRHERAGVNTHRCQRGPRRPLLRLLGLYVIKIGPAETLNGLTSGASQGERPGTRGGASSIRAFVLPDSLLPAFPLDGLVGEISSRNSYARVRSYLLALKLLID